MAFQDTAMSLRSRLHLDDVRPAVLIGVLLVGAVVLTMAIFTLASTLTSQHIEVQKADAPSEASAASQAGASEADETAKPAICVYVSGHVVNPGICYVEEGARVADAVALTGGFDEEADADAVNLARVLVDGEQVVIPSVTQAQTAGAASGSGGSGASAASGKVNINTADAATLQTLDGIGEATARKIVQDREANGPFNTVEDLKRVSGIGDKKFEALRDSICVG